MCFYNSLTVTAFDLAERYDKQMTHFDDDLYVIVPATSKNPFPIITANPKVQLYEWGLIPHWIKSKDDTHEEKEITVRDALMLQKKTQNARVEKIFEKPIFRESVMQRRCIIPSTGYIEYHHYTTKLRQPFYIYLKSNEIFSIAGMCDVWRDPVTFVVHYTFSMITVPAAGNEMVNWIHNGGRNHNRMPAILSREDEKKWLEPDLPEEEIKSLLKTYPANDMESFIISKDFKEPENYHLLSILQPIEQEICG